MYIIRLLDCVMASIVVAYTFLVKSVKILVSMTLHDQTSLQAHRLQ